MSSHLNDSGFGESGTGSSSHFVASSAEEDAYSKNIHDDAEDENSQSDEVPPAGEASCSVEEITPSRQVTGPSEPSTGITPDGKRINPKKADIRKYLQKITSRAKPSKFDASSTSENTHETVDISQSENSSQVGYTQSQVSSDPSEPPSTINAGKKRKTCQTKAKPRKIPKLTLPFLGIRRVNFNTVNRKFKKCANIPTNTFEGLKAIIEVIMEGNPEENKSKNNTSPYTLKSTNPDQFMEFYSNHRKLLPGEEFHLQMYVQRKLVTNFFRQHFSGWESEEEGEIVNSIIFYYRPNEIFYVVQNHSWAFLDWCVDYQFPRALASRLLSLKGYTSKNAIPIVGNTRYTEISYHGPEKSSNLFKPEFIIKFEANLREKSSILNLPLSIFREAQSDYSAENFIAEVGAGYFKLLKSLNKWDILSLCHHFSLICNKEHTYLYNEPGTREEDSLVYENDFMRVKRPLSTELTSNLIQTLFKPSMQEIPEEVRNFNVGHTQYKDLSKGDNFELLFQESEKVPPKQICIFNGVLQIPDIIKPIKKLISKKFPLKKKKFNLKNFVNKFYIQYTVSSNKKLPSPVLNFIQGFLIHNDNLLYWRIHGRWYQASQGYLTRTNFEFNRLLNNGVLLSPEEACYLKHKWFSEKQQIAIKAKTGQNQLQWENLYNSSYSLASGDYIIGDCGLENGIELFDIMKIVEEINGPQAYLYHVKKNIVKYIRTLCAQIDNASVVLRATDGSQLDRVKKIYSIWEKNHEHNTQVLKKYTEETFVNLLRNAIYVLAFVEGKNAKTQVTKYAGGNDTRSFALEQKTKIHFSIKNLEDVISGLDDPLHQETKLKLTAEKFRQILGRSSNKECAEYIQDLLKNGDYIEVIEINDTIMYQPTTKFVSSTAHDFKLPGCSKPQPENIWYVLSEFRSSYPSLVMKFGILRTAESLKGKFRICEIFVDDDNDSEGNKAHLEYVENKYAIKLDC